MLLYDNSIEQVGNDLRIRNIGRFDLAATLDCGQAFRWEMDENGKWHGIVGNRYLCVWQDNEGLVLENTTYEDYLNFWKGYFDFDRDYEAIDKIISVDPTLSKIVDYSAGIHILRQDPWEALCSFIISQNNNIPRIKGIINRLCENFGDKIHGGYTFPTAYTISQVSVDDLAVIRCGFRAKYIIDAAKKVQDGTLNLEGMRSMPLENALEMMQLVRGVGPKVANCALLFGCSRIECFPVDVWMGRAMKALFDGELPDVAKQYAGIVQQYIFHYARMTKLNV